MTMRGYGSKGETMSLLSISSESFDIPVWLVKKQQNYISP